MLRSRIFLKLYAGFALTILLGGGLAWMVASKRAREESLADIEANLKVRATLLREVVEADVRSGAPVSSVQPRVQRMGDAASTRFTVIREDGLVLGDSWDDPLRMENHARRPEVVMARGNGTFGVARRFSRTVRRDMMYVAVPVRGGGAILAYSRAAIPLVDVERRLANVTEIVAFGAAVAAVVALLLGVVLTRVFTRPLVRMKEVAEGIAAGDYDRRVARSSDDEIGRLGLAIERMSVQLKGRMAELSRERNELRAVLAGMREGVVAVDSGERIVQMNRESARILGIDADESLGRRIWEVTRIPEVTEMVAGVLKDGRDRNGEIRHLREERETVLEIRASPLDNGARPSSGAVLVLHDVTSLRRLELVRREFVANVSHELKTPLTAIRGFVETMIDDPEMEEATRDRFLARLRHQTLRLSRLVTDLLVLSRVESEDEALERRRIDLRDPAAESARRLGSDATGRSLRFEVHLPEEPLFVLADEEAIRQAMDNLLDNAFKYTPDEGLVELTLEREGDEAVVSVSDTGIGIDRKHLDRIFERFYRVDKARSRELGGTGLGLSIVKHIVEAHGGRATVESAAGAGSTFRLFLPLCEGN